MSEDGETHPPFRVSGEPRLCFLAHPHDLTVGLSHGKQVDHTPCRL